MKQIKLVGKKAVRCPDLGKVFSLGVPQEVTDEQAESLLMQGIFELVKTKKGVKEND